MLHIPKELVRHLGFESTSERHNKTVETGFAGRSWPDPEDAPVRAKLNTVFEWCNDVAEMRRFYTDGLGLTETHARNEAEVGFVVYQAGETQIVITRSPDPKPVLSDWTKTWGFDDGLLHEPAWVIEVEWDSFFDIVQRMRSFGVPMHGEPRDEEKIRQVVVRDPMGRTVSVDAYPTSARG